MSAGHRLFENQSSVFLLLGVAAAILLVDLGAAEL